MTYRHQVMRDLEKEPVLAAVQAFAGHMRQMRERLAQARELRYRYQKERWFLDAAAVYCEAVTSLTDDLAGLGVTSRGFRAFREYLTGYAASDGFTSLVSATRQRYDELDAVDYSVLIRGTRVRVSRYDGEPDYSAQVGETFAKFKEGAVKDYRVEFRDGPDMNHVEAQILERVARSTPRPSRRSTTTAPASGITSTRRSRRLTGKSSSTWRISSTSRRSRRAAWRSAIPAVSDRSKEIHANETFDLALAGKLVRRKLGRGVQRLLH